MQNLKIRVSDESQAEEVKRLAVKAGYKLDALFGRKWSAEFCYLVLCEDMSAGFANEIMADGDKPLSIGELRVMANPIKEWLNTKTLEYKQAACMFGHSEWIDIPEGAVRARFYPHDPDGLEFENAFYQWWHDEDNEWINYENYQNALEHSRVVWQRTIVKPIKEYLEPLRYGGYKYHKDPDAYLSTWLEIHKDAEFAVLNGNNEVDFYTGSALEKSHFIPESIVWQREQDEPFLTPECTLNDQYAGTEQVRQAIKVKSGSDSNHELDAMSFGLIGARAAQASGGAKMRENNHYFIDVSDVDEVDFYEIAKRYNVTDPAIQHILKKCLAIGNRGHKNLETDLKDILKTAKRALHINGFGE